MVIGQIPWRLRISSDLPALVAIARAKRHPLEFALQPRPVDSGHTAVLVQPVQLARSGLGAIFALAVPSPFSLVVAVEA